MNADDVMMDRSETCVFFGGPGRPIHYTTLYRWMKEGRAPRAIHVGPNSVRWSRNECLAARQRMIDERDGKIEPQPEAA